MMMSVGIGLAYVLELGVSDGNGNGGVVHTTLALPRIPCSSRPLFFIFVVVVVRLIARLIFIFSLFFYKDSLR